MKEEGGDDIINVPKRAHKKIFYFNTLTSRNPAECWILWRVLYQKKQLDCLILV